MGDFNGDGQPDLAVTNSGANGVNVFLNSESGFSAMAASPATGDSPTSVAAADFNGDGKLDLAVTNSGSNNVTILLGNGDGTFTAAASPATGTAPNSIAVADFNGDGVPDLAVANAGSNNVTILLGTGDGTFTAAAGPAAGTPAQRQSPQQTSMETARKILSWPIPEIVSNCAFGRDGARNCNGEQYFPRRRRHTSRQSDLFRGCQLWWQYLRRCIPNCGAAGLHAEWYFSFRRGCAAGTSTLTITPTNGFSGTVSLQ